MKNICKAFGDNIVLSNVELELKPGEVHILAGENGAGKSTLMKILGGVHAEFDGEIYFYEQKSERYGITGAVAKGVSIIYQELSLVPSMSVVDNIFLGREQLKSGILNRKKMRQNTGQFLSELGFDIDVNKLVEQYPIGVQQMIEICKALSLDNKIIVMDEPTSALTKPEVKKLFRIIDQLKVKGYGIIYITHKMEEIYKIADRITVLRDGRYVGTETKENLPENKLVNWMVGRELDQQFPKHKTNTRNIAFQVNNFSVAHPHKGRMPLVDNVCFEVRAGEVLGIAGLQGSGNSELLNGIFGTYGKKQITGNVTIDQKHLKKFTPRDSIDNDMALLTNDRKMTGLVLGMDIVQNTTLASLETFSGPLTWLKKAKEFKSSKIRSKQLNLKAASLKMAAGDLSGGNQQKVAIAKWIETNPKVLLLDEPTRGIDIGAKHDIYQLINQWTAQGIAIVVITSEMPELLSISDRIIVMHQGKITAEYSRGQANQEMILNAALGLNV